MSLGHADSRLLPDQDVPLADRLLRQGKAALSAGLRLRSVHDARATTTHIRCGRRPTDRGWSLACSAFRTGRHLVQRADDRSWGRSALAWFVPFDRPAQPLNYRLPVSCYCHAKLPAEPGCKHVCVLKRHPPASPAHCVPSVESEAFARLPPFREVRLLHGHEEETAHRDLIPGWPRVVPFLTERPHHTAWATGLLEQLSLRSALWRLTELDAAGGYLNPGPRQRDRVVREDGPRGRQPSPPTATPTLRWSAS